MYEIYEKLRDERKLSDYAVAKTLGIGRSTFSEWKKGDYTPKYDKLKKIADFFGVTTDYLLGNDGHVVTDRATLELWEIMKDSELMSAVKILRKLPSEKKKHVIEMIHLLASE